MEASSINRVEFGPYGSLASEERYMSTIKYGVPGMPIIELADH
jgi:hypothetical protein